MQERIGVIGLGYVGLPVALGFARKFSHTVGFDINSAKIRCLQDGIDVTGETPEEELRRTTLKMTDRPDDLKDCTFFVVAVPTPIDNSKRPDLTPVVKASELVGRVLKRGDVVVYESTVYPGVTEEVCGPILERVSGLKHRVDFSLGYSPERINPGDKERTLEKIVKVVSGDDPSTLNRVSAAYAKVIDAGVYEASSIKVAEAAKVIENTQRDLNIALMNELALIFDQLGIRTADVLRAAGTKWNFLPFKPGLVGGHCIGVDPYYLTAKAEELGHHPQVILAGRRINDGMGAFVAQKTLKLLAKKGVRTPKIGVLGITFKEDVTDIRNSRVPDIVKELREYGIEPLIWDPHAAMDEVKHEYDLDLSANHEATGLDALILAVAHRTFLNDVEKHILSRLKQPDSILIDVKSALDPTALQSRCTYWSL